MRTVTPSNERFGIQRDDGRWYAGTDNYNAVFTKHPCPSGTFQTEDAAARRGQGLLERHPDHTFKICQIANGS